MYDLGSALDGATAEPGSNLLLTGPPLSGKRKLAFEILAAGADAGEASLIVTTRDGADRVLTDYRALTDGEATVGVVDGVTEHRGESGADHPDVAYAASPTDMTGLGVEFSGFMDRFEASDAGGIRVVFDSLSVLLYYADLQTVFRFVHVVTSRVEDAGAVGIYLLESTAHDPETRNTLTQLFDGVIELDEDGVVSARLPGTDAEPVP